MSAVYIQFTITRFRLPVRIQPAGKAACAERTRPRTQQLPPTRSLSSIPTRWIPRSSLRPGTGALRGRHGFSLVEILVTMTLLTVIVFGLLMMFNQTQRAFRAGIGQTDTLEGGRGAMDVLVRDLEQITPCEAPNTTYNNKANIPMYNFWAVMDGTFTPPSVQYLPSSTVLRTNIIQRFFLLTRLNQDWNTVLYAVVPDSTGSAVGSLYRYSCVWPRYQPLGAGNDILTGRGVGGAPAAMGVWSANRVADGIVHLRLRAFDTNGVPLVPFNTRTMASALNVFRPSLTYAFGQVSFSGADELDSYYWNNAVPAYLELEMGLVDPKTLQHYRNVGPTTTAGQNYLSNNVAQVSLFRQRIPVRNVDFSAYQ